MTTTKADNLIDRMRQNPGFFAAPAKRLTPTRRGFTLMEIMTVMAIISVVSSIVLPGISNFYSSERVKAEAEVLIQNIRAAKYRAMQEQALYRLVFAPGGDAYKIQIHTGYLEGNTPPTLTTALAEPDYDGAMWESVLESDEILIDPLIMVTREAYLLGHPVVYFWPDGTLVTNDSGGITEANRIRLGECYILMEYGSSRIRIYLNAQGVLSSESYAVDEDGDSEADVLW